MSIQGRGEIKAANGLKTTILEFTEQQININMVVGDNKFESLQEEIIKLHFKIEEADKMMVV